MERDAGGAALPGSRMRPKHIGRSASSLSAVCPGTRSSSSAAVTGSFSPGPLHSLADFWARMGLLPARFHQDALMLA